LAFQKNQEKVDIETNFGHDFKKTAGCMHANVQVQVRTNCASSQLETVTLLPCIYPRSLITPPARTVIIRRRPAAACTRTPTPVFKYKLLRRLEEVAAAAISKPHIQFACRNIYPKAQKWKGNEAE
jgi:hypothetical protein